MKPRNAGRLWFTFQLFGMDWQVRVAPKDHPVLKSDGDPCMAICYLNERCIVMARNLTQEQFRTTFAHELQHAIEDYAAVDYERGVRADVHDRWTDNIALGWLYVMRHQPEIVGFLQGKHWLKQQRKKG